MAELKVSLSIGLAGCKQEDVLEVDDEEIKDCETPEELEKLLHMYWEEWSWNYIDGGFQLIEG